MKEAEAALVFVDRCASMEQADILPALSEMVEGYGFNHFIMTGLPEKGDDVEPMIVKNAWPQEWTDRYRAGRYFLDDPVTLWSLSRVQAFSWSEARLNSEVTERAKRIAGEARAFGLVDGLGCPVPLRPRQHAVVSFGADHVLDLPPSVAASIQIAAGLAQSRLIEPKHSVAANLLTRREKDILLWVALGRTRSDIAVILGISDGTVKTHIAHILTKLDALNATHAVVLAMQAKEIAF